jgi:hypothetical protein
MPVTASAARMPAPKITWRAGSDRIAHAHVKRGTRTLCGEPVLDERFAWPKFRNCMVCSAAVEQIPETELRALHGDR